MKERLLRYFKLLGKSYWRLFREFPVLLQFLFLLVLGSIISFFVKTEFVSSSTNYVPVFLLFVLGGRWICRISSSETVLLNFLRIPIPWIRTLKCLLLSLPFFFLDWSVGALLMTLGTLTIVFFPEKRIRSRFLFSFYAPGSYQWLGMYRQSGIWVLAIGFLLLPIGLWHQNTNMVCFFLGWIIIVPCFIACYSEDPSRFLSIYKHSRFLMWKKGRELLFNVAIPTGVSLGIVLLADFTNVGLYLKLTFLFVLINLLLFYCRYACYPHILTALALSAIFSLLLTGLFFTYPVIASFVCILLTAVLHLLAVHNLKSFLSNGNY